MAYNHEFREAGGTRMGWSEQSSLVDRESYFNGVYRSPHDLRIEGEYEGEIQCNGTLTIAETARVSGSVNAGNMLVSGVLEGNVSCSDRFEIFNTGKVAARVLAGAVVIHEGAFYEGDMRMHVEPAGLPAREYTRPVVEETDEPVAASPSRRRASAAADQGGDDQEGVEPLTLRAVPDS